MNNTQKWGIYWVVVASLACAGGASVFHNITKPYADVKVYRPYNSGERSLPNGKGLDSISVKKGDLIFYSTKARIGNSILVGEMLKLDGNVIWAHGTPGEYMAQGEAYNPFDNNFGKSISTSNLNLGIHILEYSVLDASGLELTDKAKVMVVEKGSD
jgi:hypothetical protein